MNDLQRLILATAKRLADRDIKPTCPALVAELQGQYSEGQVYKARDQLRFLNRWPHVVAGTNGAFIKPPAVHDPYEFSQDIRASRRAFERVVGHAPGRKARVAG